jgi:nifR3 family TIM-barrel protein
LQRAENEHHYAIQLFGSDPQVMAQAAALVLRYQPAVIDINAGCPVPKVTKTGAGAALMKTPELLAQIVSAIIKSVGGGSPVVTVKIRSGWDAASLNYEECAAACVEAGAAMISLHPRTRAQGYEGRSDWSHIAALASKIAVPVCGSGDLYSAQDAVRMFDETGAASLMFARGALGNPFIFRQTKDLLQGENPRAASFEERVEMAFRHLELLAADAGEKSACLEMRKTFCAYIKGCAGAAALRNRLVHASSIAEYREILCN